MRRAKPILFLGIFICYLGMMVILPIVSPLVRQLGLSESQGGWMISIGAATMVLASARWGRLSDKIGRRPVILAGFAGLAASYAAYTACVMLGLGGALAGTTLLAALILGRALIGVFIPAVPTASQAYMADVTDEAGRSAGMALVSAANGMALILGPAIGGVLLLGGLLWPLYAATMLPLMGLGAMLLVLRSTRPKSMAAQEPLRPWHADLWPWLLVGLGAMTVIVTLQINAGFYLQDRLGLSALETGRTLAMALTITGLVLLLVQVVQVKLLRWQAGRMVTVGIPVFAAGILILLMTMSLWSYYVAFALIGLGAGLVLPGFMSGASLAVPATLQGSVAGLVSAVQGGGAIIAPALTTSLYEYDPALPFWFVFAILAVLQILCAVALPKRPVTRR